MSNEKLTLREEENFSKQVEEFKKSLEQETFENVLRDYDIENLIHF